MQIPQIPKLPQNRFDKKAFLNTAKKVQRIFEKEQKQKNASQNA